MTLVSNLITIIMLSITIGSVLIFHVNLALYGLMLITFTTISAWVFWEWRQSKLIETKTSEGKD